MIVISIVNAASLMSLQKKTREYNIREKKHSKLKQELLSRRYQGKSIEEICKRPEVTPGDVSEIIGHDQTSVENREIITTLVLDMKYAGYVKRAEKRYRVRRRYSDVSLSHIKDYQDVGTVTIEAREALNMKRPRTLADAEAIPAVRQADLDALVLYIMKNSVSRET